MLELINSPYFLTYAPNHNYCGIGGFGGFSILAYFYLAFLITIAIITCVIFKTRRHLLKKSIFITLAVFCVMYVGVQTTQQVMYLKNKVIKNYWGKTFPQRLSAVIGERLFEFIKFCRTTLPGKHYAELITDMNLNATIEPYVLSYYLYPQIDIDVDRSQIKDCIIIFNKPDAKDVVPNGYTIKAVFDNNNLIAVRNIN